MCVYIYLYLFIFIYIYSIINVYVCLSVCVCVHACVHARVCVRVSVNYMIFFTFVVQMEEGDGKESLRRGFGGFSFIGKTDLSYIYIVFAVRLFCFSCFFLSEIYQDLVVILQTFFCLSCTVVRILALTNIFRRIVSTSTEWIFRNSLYYLLLSLSLSLPLSPFISLPSLWLVSVFINFCSIRLRD